MMKRIIMLLLACCLLVGAAAAAGGSGTAADPYIIETPAELQSIQNNLAAYYVLGNDIDLSSYSFSTIGSKEAPFTGSLNGNGFTISNGNIGLFGVINRATISNIIFNNFDNTQTYSILTGLCLDSCIINNVDINNSHMVYGGSGGATSLYIGVLDGSAHISNCDVTNTILESNYYNTGCIVGYIGGPADNLIIESSTVTNTIIIVDASHHNAGCFIGSVGYTSSSIIDCVSQNNLIVSGGYIGGIVGRVENSGSVTISNCNVIGCTFKGLADNSVGGVVGQIDSGSSASVSDCSVSDCSVLSVNGAGGISATSATITNCDVVNTNLYAPSNIYNIGPSGSYDTTSTASGITNVPNRYLYASGLTATPNGKTVSYTLDGRQGSTTVETTQQGTAQSWAWTFGDGVTSSVAEDTTHTYAAPGTYSTSLTLKNYLDSTGITVTTSDYNILPIPPTVSASANILQLGQSTTLSAVGTLFSSIQWQYSTDSGATWQDISGATTATYEWTPEAGSYQVRAHVTAAGTGYTANSEVLSLTVYPPPTITNPNANPQQGPLSQSVVLSADVSDVNGDTTYQWQEFASRSWIDISGATTNPATVLVSDGTGTLHQYRLAASGVGGTSYSSTVTYQSVAPPQFTAFEVSPLSGGIPLEVSFSATASDTSGYRWEYSTDGNIWVQIATGSAGSYTFANEGVYYIRVIATGTGGTTTSDVATITASNLLPEFTQISATPSAGVAPFSVTLSAAATNGATFVWERQSGSSWVQIGTGASLTYTIPSGTSVGMVYFRAIAANQYGSVISASISVEVGAAPAAEITTPTEGAVFGSGRLISFAAADAGAGVTYSWNFGDGQTGSGRTVTHSYSENGFFMVTLTTSSQFGSSEDVVRIEIVEASGDIWLANTDVSSSGVTLQATIEVSPVSSGTLVWFELESMSGTVVYKSPQLTYSGPVSYTASGLPLMAGESYRAVAYSNYYGYSIPVQVTLVDAVQPPYEQLGNAWNDGLNREPFNVSALVAAGVGVYGGALGGGAVGGAVAFGVIVMFVLVGLWLRQQDIVIPLTLTLIAGWFVIGNLPGDWQPIAYTLMVVCVVAIFFYLFRKRIE